MLGGGRGLIPYMSHGQEKEGCLPRKRRKRVRGVERVWGQARLGREEPFTYCLTHRDFLSLSDRWFTF